MSQTVPLHDLLRFLATAGEKGWIRGNTASAMKIGCERVLSGIEPDRLLNLAELDVDRVIREFSNRNPDVSPSSLSSYASRIRSAIRMFTEMKANPTGWKPPAGRPNGAARAASPLGSKSPKRDVAPRAVPREPRHEHPQQIDSAEAIAITTASFDRGLSYPFPLRPEVIITLANVPKDLTKTEAARIGAFLSALAIHEEK